MNLIPAIRQMEKEISDREHTFRKEIQELKDGLKALRKINTVCEKCNGKGKYLRPRACAEDDRPNPDDPTDYLKCSKCNGTGKVKHD